VYTSYCELHQCCRNEWSGRNRWVYAFLV
jgi:hypothetical protein